MIRPNVLIEELISILPDTPYELSSIIQSEDYSV